MFFQWSFFTVPEGNESKMDTDTVVERATPRDLPDLVRLLTILFEQERDFAADAAKQQSGLRLILDSPEIGQIFVARQAGQVVGTVSLLFTVSTYEGGWACWLEDLVVLDDSRGAGVGSRLVEAAIEYARQQGFSRITLLTDQDNAGAIRLYERHGFRRSSMTPLRLRLATVDRSA